MTQLPVGRKLNVSATTAANYSPGPLKLFVTIYNDARLLSHFLRHYTAIGVGHFFIAVSPDLLPNAQTSAADYPVTLCTEFDLSRSVFETGAVTGMRTLHQTESEWVVILDLDEFVECSNLHSIIESADMAGTNVVRGIMHDRFAADGQLGDASPEAQLSEAFPVKSRFIREVMKGCDHKGVLVKGRLLPAAQHHRFEGERVFHDVLEISHYKWTAGAIERLRKSHRLAAEAGIAWSTEYKRALDHYETHGRFAWEAFGGKLAADFTPELPPGHCTECGAALSEAEVGFSTKRYGRTLCRSDQRSLQSKY